MTDPGRTIDLNADLGEGCPWDEAILERVSSASVSCGAHAGDPDSIHRTLAAARARGVVIGAHPGYPDRANFGRAEWAIESAEVEALVIAQVASLDGLARQSQLPLRFLKPHGALYNQAQRDRAIALGVVAATGRLNLPVLGQPGGLVESIASENHVAFIAEGFADRRYQDNGRLVPRSAPDAILRDPAEIAAQVLRLVDRGIETICLHGDNPDSIALADLVRATLGRAGIAVRSFLDPGR